MKNTWERKGLRQALTLSWRFCWERFCLSCAFSSLFCTVIACSLFTPAPSVDNAFPTMPVEENKHSSTYISSTNGDYFATVAFFVQVLRITRRIHDKKRIIFLGKKLWLLLQPTCRKVQSSPPMMNLTAGQHLFAQTLICSSLTYCTKMAII